MPADLSRISVILVEPIYAGNVGAVARIMNNFCFTDLRIVGSVPQKNDFYLAMHSEHILDEAKIFPTLADAIADLDRVIAFSRRLGKTKPVDHSPMQMAAYVHSLPELKIGLVFGRENIWSYRYRSRSLPSALPFFRKTKIFPPSTSRRRQPLLCMKCRVSPNARPSWTVPGSPPPLMAKNSQKYIAISRMCLRESDTSQTMKLRIGTHFCKKCWLN
jgi:hypothetical protein